MAALLPVSLALIAAWLWAVNGILVRRSSDRGVAGIGAAFTMALYGIFLPWTIHIAGWVRGDWALWGDLRLVGFFIGSGVLGAGLGRWMSYRGIAAVGAGVNASALAIRPVLAGALAMVWLNEVPTPMVAVGVALIVTGVALLPWSGGGAKSGWRATALVFPFSAAALFAVADVVRRHGLAFDGTPLLFAAALHETAGVAVLAFFWARTRRATGAARPRGGLLWPAALAATVSQVLVFGALATGDVAVVIALVSSSPVWTAILAAFVLRTSERVTWVSLSAAFLAVTGAAFLAFS